MAYLRPTREEVATFRSRERSAEFALSAVERTPDQRVVSIWWLRVSERKLLWGAIPKPSQQLTVNAHGANLTAANRTWTAITGGSREDQVSDTKKLVRGELEECRGVYEQPASGEARMFTSIGVPELLVVVVAAVLIVWPAAQVCRKAGFSPWLGIAAAIPGANIILLWFLALAEWPTRRRGA